MKCELFVGQSFYGMQLGLFISLTESLIQHWGIILSTLLQIDERLILDGSCFLMTKWTHHVSAKVHSLIQWRSGWQGPQAEKALRSPSPHSSKWCLFNLTVVKVQSLQTPWLELSKLFDACSIHNSNGSNTARNLIIQNGLEKHYRLLCCYGHISLLLCDVISIIAGLLFLAFILILG